MIIEKQKTKHRFTAKTSKQQIKKAALITMLLLVFTLSVFQPPVKAWGYWYNGTVDDYDVYKGEVNGGDEDSFELVDNDCFNISGHSSYPVVIDLVVHTYVHESSENQYRVKIYIDHNDWQGSDIPYRRLYVWIHHDTSEWELLAIITSNTHSGTYYIDSDNYWKTGNYAETMIRFTTDIGVSGWYVLIDAAVIQAYEEISPK